MDEFGEIKKRLYGVRDYIVKAPIFQGEWYNDVMDDLDYIFDFLDAIKQY
jgi:hypothetical protein